MNLFLPVALHFTIFLLFNITKKSKLNQNFSLINRKPILCNYLIKLKKSIKLKYD